MDTLTKSCSPTTVITANGEVQTHEEATVYVKRIGYILDFESPRKHASSIVAWKALRWKTDILVSGPTVKNHISLKTGFGYHAIRRTSFLLWIQACQVRPLDLHQIQRHLQDRRVIPHHLLPPHLLHLQQVKFRLENERIELRGDISPVHVSSTVDGRSGRPDETQANKTPKPNKKKSKKEQSDSLCSEIPEWLQEFRENVVDDEIPVHGDSHASSSHEVSLEPTFKRREDLGKHSVYTHFPKDRNCEICKRTKITRAPCRRRNSGAVPRADNFGDLITADHKVLSDNCESRNNQDLATQWIQAYPCKTTTSQETQRSLQKFLEPDRKPKSHLHWQFLGIWQSLWRSFLESLHVYTTQIRNKWDCWKSSAQSKGRHLCCIVAIGSKWKLVSTFYGMLHLSAKRHRSII